MSNKEFKWHGRELKYAYQRLAYGDVRKSIRESAERLADLADIIDKDEHFNEVERTLKYIIPLLTDARITAIKHDIELRIRAEVSQNE